MDPRAQFIASWDFPRLDADKMGECAGRKLRPAQIPRGTGENALSARFFADRTRTSDRILGQSNNEFNYFQLKFD
jgi:hypothetical protein